jgi:hypothetical protein
VHYADADGADAVVNEQVLRAIESSFGPKTRFPLDLAATAFVNFLLEANKLERLQERGPIFEIPELDFPLSILMARPALQL